MGPYGTLGDFVRPCGTLLDCDTFVGSFGTSGDLVTPCGSSAILWVLVGSCVIV